MFPQVPEQVPVTATGVPGLGVIRAFGLAPFRFPPAATPQPFIASCVLPIVRSCCRIRQFKGLPLPATARAPGTRIVAPRTRPKKVGVDSETTASTKFGFPANAVAHVAPTSLHRLMV